MWRGDSQHSQKAVSRGTSETISVVDPKAPEQSPLQGIADGVISDGACMKKCYAMSYWAIGIIVATMSSHLPMRHALLLVLVLGCQSVLMVHDTQHISPDVSKCTVCQAHLPQIAVLPGDALPLPIHAIARQIPLVELDWPAGPGRTAFRSRAPPHQHP